MTARATLYRWGLPLGIAAVSLLCQAFAAQATAPLRFDRVAVLAGEWWRLLTGNIVHLGWNHLLLNLAGLALIWVLFPATLTPTRAAVLFTFSSLAVTVGLLEFTPSLHWYVGLSGALHGILVGAAVMSLRRDLRMEQWLLAGVGVKILWEQWHGPSADTEKLVGGAVVVDAHLYGALGGLLIGLAAWAAFGLRRRRTGAP
jgi:rhomboid family GlyGly-CTERM serine protease